MILSTLLGICITVTILQRIGGGILAKIMFKKRPRLIAKKTNLLILKRENLCFLGPYRVSSFALSYDPNKGQQFMGLLHLLSGRLGL